MKMKVLLNTSDKDVKDYPVSEAKMDRNGNPVINVSTGLPVSTGETFEWSLKSGETLEFPSYVADYLVGIYPFLEDLGEKEVVEEEVKEEVADPASTVVEVAEKLKEKEVPVVEGALMCKTCGAGPFSKKMTLGSHIGAKHPEVLDL